MKKPSVLLTVALSVLLCACADDIEDAGNGLLTADPVSADMSESNSVSINAIAILNQDTTVDSRSSDNTLSRIECIKSITDDTCLYVYKKKEGGWTIYSTDTRVPPVVAQSDSGSFENLMQIPAARLWIESMAEDLAAIRQLPDSKLNFTKKEIENNKNFWESISSPDKFVRKIIDIGDIDTTRLIPRGHYELHRTITTTEILEDIFDLTLTRWHQDDPYNRCCPLRTDNPQKRAPVGCVPLAAAQVLFYLHYHLGVPEKAPSTGECIGNINSFTSTQSDYNSEIWDIMKTDSTATAPFLANCGMRVGVQYGNTGTGAVTSRLVDSVFAPYGISCRYDTLVPSVLISNLRAKLPVILRATDSTQESGHAFITDRYRRSRTVTINNYVWVYDNPVPGGALPFVPDKNEYVYISPETEYIGMNWGWGKEAYKTNEWFTLTGDWMSSYAPIYNWKIGRCMICDFEVSENQ